LTIVRCLEEIRWLVNENRHPVLIYTDYECLRTALQNSDKGQIVGWQLRLSEYDFRIIHTKGKENTLADRMSRLPVEAMDFGRLGKEESVLEIMDAENIAFRSNAKDMAFRSNSENVAFRSNAKNVAFRSNAEDIAFGSNAEDIVFRSNTEAQPVPHDVAIASDEEGADKRWEYWLADEWYAGVVLLKLFGKLREKDGGEDSLTVWRWWTWKAAAYQLIDEQDDYPLLAYMERNG